MKGFLTTRQKTFLFLPLIKKALHMKVSEKLAALRSALQARQLNACIIPTYDPHQNKFLADHWKGREWFTGFTGSEGTVVVTAEDAGLWVDFRYYVQAEEQLKGSGIQMQKLPASNLSAYLDWLKENLPDGSKIGFDGRLMTVGQVRRMAKHFASKKIELDSSVDLIGEIWKDRPALPQNPIYEFDLKYAGVTAAQKLETLRSKMNGADFYLLTTLDDVAWLFNLRGSDVETTPVFYAYAVIGKDAAFLFIEMRKVSIELRERLNAIGVIVKPYDALEDSLKNIPEGKTILLDLSTTSNQVYNAIEPKKIMEGDNLVAPLKAIKNPVEISHIRSTMCKDAVALTRLFRWLEQTLAERSVPETEVAERLIEFRRAQGNYFDESFSAIVGYNANGAIVHYRPEPGNCAEIRPGNGNMLLLDSGGNYLDGTTDITRTVALGEPTAEQKRDFTLVLKGHIALATTKFPQGTGGAQLDTLARQFLWQHGLNFGHGTGHGVGYFLNVHEPPQGFTPAANTPRGAVPFEPGMLTSNEPGLYKTGKYGIRIENLLLCQDDQENEFGKFYRFDTVTLFPMDVNLMEKNLLSEEERAWVNRYQREVFEKVSPLLEKEEVDWLAEKCRGI